MNTNRQGLRSNSVISSTHVLLFISNLSNKKKYIFIFRNEQCLLFNFRYLL